MPRMSEMQSERKEKQVVRGAGTRDEPLRTSAWEAMSTWPQQASGARGSGVQCLRGGRGLGGIQKC